MVPYRRTRPLSSENAVPAAKQQVVEGTGFEPVYAKRADLQSAGFNHTPTPPQAGIETSFDVHAP